MTRKRLLLGTALLATLTLPAAWVQAQRGPGASQSQAQPQGWAVRASLNDPSAKLYNNVKQKLLDGKQVACFTISKLDVKLYCEVAQHYDYIWFEMQHSTLSFRDVEEMIAACPRPVATPVIRLPDASEGNIQKATDIGALGIDIPTVDTPEMAMQAARYARFPPEGRRSQGGGQAAAMIHFELFARFALMSLLAFGGGQAALPLLERVSMSCSLLSPARPSALVMTISLVAPSPEGAPLAMSTLGPTARSTRAPAIPSMTGRPRTGSRTPGATADATMVGPTQ